MRGENETRDEGETKASGEGLREGKRDGERRAGEMKGGDEREGILEEKRLSCDGGPFVILRIASTL